MRIGDNEIAERVRDYDKRSALYRSLSDVARHVEPGGGILTGFAEIDALTNGLRANKLNLVVGRSNHGKTAFAKSVFVNNPDLPKVYITADDSDDIILRDMLAMSLHLSVSEVESRGPDWRARMVGELFGDRLVVAYNPSGSSYSVAQIKVLLDQAMEDLGEPPQLVAFDYLELLRVDQQREPFTTVKRQISDLKSIIRHSDMTWMILHQCNRGAMGNGPLTMSSLNYGGEQETDGVMVGCRRAIDTEDLSDEEKELESSLRPTVNVSVMKNKVTGKRSNPDGFRYLIDPVSGYLREILRSDVPPPRRSAEVVEIAWRRGGGT